MKQHLDICLLKFIFIKFQMLKTPAPLEIIRVLYTYNLATN